jgi:hypothetical protein
MLQVHLQPESHIPLYVQLRDQVRALVYSGELRSGDRIPASRELAGQLGIHRTTVANAYAELEAEGLIEGHVGRGTFICAPTLKQFSPPPRSNGNGGAMRWESLFADERGMEGLSRVMPEIPPGAIAFTAARPSDELFPLEEFRRCVNTVLRREGRKILQLGSTDGYAPLKQAVMELLRAEGLDVRPGELLITDGCQQAIDLICKAFLRPGDSVALENPAYPGAIAIFAGARVRMLPVGVRTDTERTGHPGLDIDALEAVLLQNRIKLIFVTPDFHNPTGLAGACHSLPGARGGRRHLWAAPPSWQADTVAQGVGCGRKRDSNRQLFEDRVSGPAHRLVHWRRERDRTFASGEAIDGLAQRSAFTGLDGGIPAPRPSGAAYREDEERVSNAPGGDGKGAGAKYAARRDLDARRRRNDAVGHAPAGIRCWGIADSRTRTGHYLSAGAVFLRPASAAEYPALGVCQRG